MVFFLKRTPGKSAKLLMPSNLQTRAGFLNVHMVHVSIVFDHAKCRIRLIAASDNESPRNSFVELGL